MRPVAPRWRGLIAEGAEARQIAAGERMLTQATVAVPTTPASPEDSDGSEGMHEDRPAWQENFEPRRQRLDIVTLYV
jgi:hypothetical protein